MKMPPVLISAPSIPRRAEKRYRFSLQFSGRVLQFCKMGWHWSGSFIGADAHIGPAEHTIYWADRVVGPYNTPPLPVGADDSVRPQNAPAFTEIYCEFAASQQAE